jgi:serine/threonine protein kinase
MGAYEYTNLKNAKAFDVAIQAASAALQAELPARYSPELSDFLLTTLHLDADKRLSVADMLRHPWMTLHTSAVTSALPVPPQPVPAYRHRQVSPQQQQQQQQKRAQQQQQQQQQAATVVPAKEEDAYSTVSYCYVAMIHICIYCSV